eukprot:SAG11_NODE_20950_length_432_cov_0.747024_2_plen_45_part_01
MNLDRLADAIILVNNQHPSEDWLNAAVAAYTSLDPTAKPAAEPEP